MDDLGGIWIQIPDAIRDNAYVNAIREDPIRIGLLFTDIIHGVYISYGEGTSWRERKSNLPNIRITNNRPRDDELAVARHSRAGRDYGQQSGRLERSSLADHRLRSIPVRSLRRISIFESNGTVH